MNLYSISKPNDGTHLTFLICVFIINWTWGNFHWHFQPASEAVIIHAKCGAMTTLAASNSISAHNHGLVEIFLFLFLERNRLKHIPEFLKHITSTYKSTKSTLWLSENYDNTENDKLGSIARAPIFGRHQFFRTSEHYGKAHGSLLSGWMNYYYTDCCWFPTSSNILILPSQFWQIKFKSCWLHCSECRILVLLRYMVIKTMSSTKSLWKCMVCVSTKAHWNWHTTHLWNSMGNWMQSHVSEERHEIYIPWMTIINFNGHLLTQTPYTLIII